MEDNKLKKSKRIAALSAAMLMCSGVLSDMSQGLFDITKASAAQSVVINETTFPDAIFRNYIKTIFD